MLKIDNMQEATNLLNNILYYFLNIEGTEKKITTDLINKEAERDDLLHEIELSEMNAVERIKTYGKLRKVLKERREIKDKIALINTMKGYANKFIQKGICAETETTIKNIETLKNNNENRKYTPRILKDLKCAKSYKKEECNENTKSDK